MLKWEYVLTERVYRKFSRPIASFLARFNVSPNSVTIFATLFGILAAIPIALGYFWESALLVFVAQILDCVDGDLARMTGRVTRRGAFLDRVFDRFVDAALIIGAIHLNPQELWLPGSLAIVGSFGVSISRVMAEAEGAECKVGIGGRDTRLALLMVSLLAAEFYGLSAIVAGLWAIALLGFLTTAHRIAHTLKQL